MTTLRTWLLKTSFLVKTEIKVSRKPGHDIDPFVLYLAALGKKIKREKGITLQPQIIISQAPNKRVRSNFNRYP